MDQFRYESLDAGILSLLLHDLLNGIAISVIALSDISKGLQAGIGPVIGNCLLVNILAQVPSLVLPVELIGIKSLFLLLNRIPFGPGFFIGLLGLVRLGSNIAFFGPAL